MKLKKDKTAEYDRSRQASQAPVKLGECNTCSLGGAMYRVAYLTGRGQRERFSPRYYRKDHAERALSALKAKYGQRNAVILVD